MDIRFVVLGGALVASAALAEAPASPADVCALMPGEKVPAGLVALGADGETFDLSAALAEQPTLILFYRGGW